MEKGAKEMASELVDALHMVSDHVLSPPHISLEARSLAAALQSESFTDLAILSSSASNDWSVSQLKNAYKAQTDCMDNPLLISRCISAVTGRYAGNSISDAQLFLARQRQFLPDTMRRATTISDGILAWAADNDSAGEARHASGSVTLKKVMEDELLRIFKFDAKDADDEANPAEDGQSAAERHANDSAREYECSSSCNSTCADSCHDPCHDPCPDPCPTPTPSPSYAGQDSSSLIKCYPKRKVRWAKLKKLKHKLKMPVVIGLVVWLILLIFTLYAIYQLL